jgi:hypothetical protein
MLAPLTPKLSLTAVLTVAVAPVLIQAPEEASSRMHQPRPAQLKSSRLSGTHNALRKLISLQT